MDQVRLGATGLHVSRVCLGMMSYGNDSATARGCSTRTAAEPIVRARGRGRRHLLRHRRRLLAGRQRGRDRAARAPSTSARDEAVIATKVFTADDARPQRRAASRASTSSSAIDASLQRLDMDYVDLYQIHRWDPHDADRGDDGRARTTSCARARRATSAPAACTPGSSPRPSTWPSATAGRRFVSMQNHYNLLYREEEREMIPQCIDQGIGVIPWSPLARGFLAGNRTRDGERRTTRAETDPLHGLSSTAARATSTSSTASRGGGRARRTPRRRSRWRGCCTSRASPRRSSARPSSSTSRRPSPPPTCRCHARRSSASRSPTCPTRCSATSSRRRGRPRPQPARDLGRALQRLLPARVRRRRGRRRRRRQRTSAARLAACPAGGDLLDVPCGYGRHAIPLARAGYRVDGSRPLADAARRGPPAGGRRALPELVEATTASCPSPTRASTPR